MGPSHGKSWWWWSVSDRDAVWLYPEWRQKCWLHPSNPTNLFIIYTMPSAPSAACWSTACGGRQAEHLPPFWLHNITRSSRIVIADPKWPTHDAALVKKHGACEQIPSLGDKVNSRAFLNLVDCFADSSNRVEGVSSIIALLHICFVWTIFFVRGQWIKLTHQPIHSVGYERGNMQTKMRIRALSVKNGEKRRSGF